MILNNKKWRIFESSRLSDIQNKYFIKYKWISDIVLQAYNVFQSTLRNSLTSLPNEREMDLGVVSIKLLYSSCRTLEPRKLLFPSKQRRNSNSFPLFLCLQSVYAIFMEDSFAYVYEGVFRVNRSYKIHFLSYSFYFH